MFKLQTSCESWFDQETRARLSVTKKLSLTRVEAALRCGGAARQGLLGPSRHSPALVGTPRRLRAEL
ncbi:Transforming Acidic Coiled-Coil-Containing Protein 3 [Manis pentadactyla]|nr:Transforming Acidic Coiled-Coil-Containing Protein 3 [Manis pentadactyla]